MHDYSCHSITSVFGKIVEFDDCAFSYFKSVIGKGLFKYNYSLVSIEIKGKITELPADTFWECYYLEDVKLPDTIKTIGNAAFGCCYMIDELILPASTTKVEYHALWGMKGLKRVVFGNKVEEIGGEQFRDAFNLEEIVFPASLKTISESIFSYMSDDVKNYLVIKAPKGSKAAKYFETEGFDITYTK